MEAELRFDGSGGSVRSKSESCRPAAGWMVMTLLAVAPSHFHSKLSHINRMRNKDHDSQSCCSAKCQLRIFVAVCVYVV